MEGKLEIWCEGFLLGNACLTNWEDFLKALCLRFGSCGDVIKEFSKLEQEESRRMLGKIGGAEIFNDYSQSFLT